MAFSPSRAVAAAGAPSAAASVVPMFNQPGPLPSLQALEARARYRSRPEDEMEEATWYLADADTTEEGQLAAPAPVRLRSVHSKQASVVKFCNKSGRPVRALWVDFDGNEVAYSVIDPGTTRLYRTYCTHPWIVRELTTGARMLLSGAAAVVGMQEEQLVDIMDPPGLEWGLDTHRCFPEGFRAGARELLKAHHRLSSSTTTADALFSSPPCSPKPLRSSSSTTTTTLQLSTPQTQLSIAITTDNSPSADCGSYQALPSPLSPRRTINITVNATGSSLGVNIQSHTLQSVAEDSPDAVAMTADQAPLALPRPPQSPAPRSRRALMSGLKSGLSTIKGLVSPRRTPRRPASPAALLAGPADAAAAAPFAVALQLGQEPAAEPAFGGSTTNLGALPHHLALRIIELAAPDQWQGTHLPPIGRPAIKPITLACSPDTKTQREEEAEAAAEAAAAAAAHQQQQAQVAAPALLQGQPPLVAALHAFIQQGWQMWGPLAAGAAAGAAAVGAAAEAEAAALFSDDEEEPPGLVSDSESDAGGEGAPGVPALF